MDTPGLGRRIGQSLTWLAIAALVVMNLSKVV